MLLEKMNTGKLRLRLGGAVSLLLLAFLFVFHARNDEAAPQINTPSKPGEASSRSVAKISVVYGDPNENYIHAVATHTRHAERHGYPIHVLRNALVDGYWNKCLYILQVLVQELGKNAADRVQWWFDADSMIINQEIPLEVFLPPSDFSDVHFLATKDHNGLNTGIFFVRVHRWSISMLIKVLGFPMFEPEIDLGFSADQMAMGIVFNETEFAPNVVYQPRVWYNTYEFKTAYEGKPGDMLVHFPGLEDARSRRMNAWWEVLNDDVAAAQWTVPLAKTDYPAKTERFWNTMREGRTMIRLVEDYTRSHLAEKQGKHYKSLMEELDRLKYAVSEESDREMAMETAIERMQLLFAEDMKTDPEPEGKDDGGGGR